MAALLLAGLVVTLGAYTRLSHAGLGCPDWPGCYGKIIAPADEAAVAAARAAYPDRPVSARKASIEMVHRYAAGTLGLAILGIAMIAWRHRRAFGQPLKVPLALLALVVFQSLLGMWTVTLLLKPIVVSAHLLGGMAILSLLFWLVLGGFFHAPLAPGSNERMFPWAVAALCVLVLQIFLGGWVSANYSALVCPEFPACRAGEWWPGADFREAFTFWRGTGANFEGGVLDLDGRTAVHLAHRAGALLSFIVIGAAAIRAILRPTSRARRLGLIVGLLLLAQIGLGVGNVLLRLPLPLAVAHNATAALLLLSLVALLHHAVLNRNA